VKEAYDRAVAERLVNGQQLPPPEQPAATVNRLILAFWRYAEQHYRRPAGTSTNELRDYRLSLKPLRDLSLFERTMTPDTLPVRLLGVGATNLTRDRAVQGQLFEDEGRRRLAALDQVVDTIRQQLGSEAIQRGSLFQRRIEENPEAAE
jgi:hypothetical protein